MASVLLTFSFFSACEEDFTTESTENTEKSSVASVISVVKSSFLWLRRRPRRAEGSWAQRTQRHHEARRPKANQDSPLGTPPKRRGEPPIWSKPLTKMDRSPLRSRRG